MFIEEPAFFICLFSAPHLISKPLSLFTSDFYQDKNETPDLDEINEKRRYIYDPKLEQKYGWNSKIPFEPVNSDLIVNRQNVMKTDIIP